MKIDGYSLLATVNCAEKPSAIEGELRKSAFTFGLGIIENEYALKDYLHGEALLDPYISGADAAGLCASITVRLPDGRTQKSVETPRSAAGPDLRFLILGSGFNGGTIEECALRIRHLPEKHMAATYIAKDLKTAIDTLRIRVQNFNAPAWLRLTLPGDSEQARLSFGFEGASQLCEGHFEDFCKACSAGGLSRAQAPAGYPDGEHNVIGAPPLFDSTDATHRAEFQLSLALSWKNCAGFMLEAGRRSAGIYYQQSVLCKAFHHAAIISMHAYSSGMRGWVSDEARELCGLAQKYSGRVLELIDLGGGNPDLKKFIPSDPLFERIRRAI